MKVKEYKEVYEEASSTLSSISRSIAMAGIGIIWIFAKTDSNQIIPNELVCPTILLVASLAFDMLQYLYKTIVFYIVFKSRENSGKIDKHSNSINIATWILWSLKIISVFLAYALILRFLLIY